VTVRKRAIYKALSDGQKKAFDGSVHMKGHIEENG